MQKFRNKNNAKILRLKLCKDFVKKCENFTKKRKLCKKRENFAKNTEFSKQMQNSNIYLSKGREIIYKT